MPTRTAVLARFVTSGSPTQTAVVTVPAGFTYIVKQINISNFTAVLQNAVVFPTDATFTFGGRIISQTIPASSILQYIGALVLGPGDQLIYRYDVDGVYLWVSGTKLAGVAAP